MSDKALLEHARNGSADAAAMLIRRLGYQVDDIAAVMIGLRKLGVLSVNAAKRVIAANATA